MTALFRSTALIASIAVAGFVTVGPLALGEAASPSLHEVHQLPRVVVVGQVSRSTAQPTVVQLPRVVVTGRRTVAPDTALAQADRQPAAGS
jgi:hypothetical protein